MEEIKIRVARLDDLPILYEFEQGIVIAERPFNETLTPGHINYYDIEAMIKSNETEVFVAVLEDEIVGSAYASIRLAKAYFKYTEYVYLGFMYVKPTHRGKGFNKIIIEELKTWARSKNITELQLDVYDANHPAIRAYEKAGFKKNLINMRMSI